MAEFEHLASYRLYSDDVSSNFRYIRTAVTEQFLEAVRTTASKREQDIKCGTTLWRAQLGCAWEKVEEKEGWGLPRPHPPERMKPLVNRAIEGRADAVQNLKELASQSRSAAARSDWTAAREALCTIQNRLAEPNGAPLDAADAQSLALRAANLSRRIHLVEEGVLPRHALDPP